MTGPAGPAVAEVYLDACCFIYLVEGQPRVAVGGRRASPCPWSEREDRHLAALQARVPDEAYAQRRSCAACAV
jgi:hypothetical protein